MPIPPRPRICLRIKRPWPTLVPGDNEPGVAGAGRSSSSLGTEPIVLLLAKNGNEISLALMRAWLEFKDERVSVDGSCAIGRLPENQIVLDDAQVSRRHALVQAHGSGGHWLIDFGSSNGSLLNHRRVFEPTRLNDKDEIEIAGHRLVFREKRELAQGGPAYNAAAWKATERCTQTFAATNHGAILLDEAGKIATITPQAREWLAQYFKQPKGNTLPENLRHWLERQRQVAEDHTRVPAGVGKYV